LSDEPKRGAGDVSRRSRFLHFLLAALVVAGWLPAGAAEIDAEAPAVFLRGVPFQVLVKAPKAAEPIEAVLRDDDGTVLARVTVPAHGEARFPRTALSAGASLPLRVEAAGEVVKLDRALLPGWVSVLPPLVAIGLALAVHEVVTSLFVGIWLGAFFLAGYNPFAALLATIDRFIQPALANPDHAAIVVFSLMLGGMVGLITRMGGVKAIVDALQPVATTRRRGQLATWGAGLAICFDDYANTLIVGNTMRPLTDRLKISREKLAYLVDSTAAPVAAIFFVSTWVGFEISLIADGLHQAAQQHAGEVALVAELEGASAFGVFLHSVPYLFYPILALFFAGMLAWTGRDFGPMLRAERRTLSGGGVYRPGAQLAANLEAEGPDPSLVDRPARWWHGAMPVLVVIVSVLVGLFVTGYRALGDGQEATLSHIVGGADPFRTLLWGSLLGVVTALVLAVGGRRLSLAKAIEAWLGGMRSMLLAVVILVLAWSLGEVTSTLGTAPYISSLLSERLPVHLLPVIVFLTAALVSFATGTSWGTMAILFPIVIPLAVTMGGAVDFDSGAHYTILLGTISSVMAGSVFGDHCSPISDTTVLSSMASGCDHLDHVRTQMPYAVTVALVGMAVGDIPTAYGVPNSIALALGVAILVAVVFLMGRRAERPGS
jgi:Na+/H+ antiporter NhaC